MGLLIILQYFLMEKLGALNPGAAAQMESMKEMMGTSALVSLIVYGGSGVLMIVVAFGCFLYKRWARPFALTLGWSWLYMGVIMMGSLAMMMGPMKNFMNDAMAVEMAKTPDVTAPASMDTFVSIFMIFYLAFIFVFLILVPGILIKLNWHQDVRHTLESRDPQTRWTDRRPTPVIGLVICAITFAVFSLPSILMMNQPWMAHFFQNSDFSYAFYLMPFAWAYVAWGSYRGQFAAWIVALLVLIGGMVFGIMNMRGLDWAVMYKDMGMPEAETERLASMMGQMLAPKKMGVLMGISMLPILGYLLWVVRFFRKETA